MSTTSASNFATIWNIGLTTVQGVLLTVYPTVAQVPSAVDIPAFAVHPAFADVPAAVGVPAFDVDLTVTNFPWLLADYICWCTNEHIYADISAYVGNSAVADVIAVAFNVFCVALMRITAVDGVQK